MCNLQREEGRPGRFAVCGFFIRPRGQRALAEARRSWLNSWVGKSRRALAYGGGLVSNSLAASRERLEIGGWRLDVEEPADFTLLCLSSSSSSSTSTRRLQCDDAASHCGSVAQYLQWPHRTRRFVPWSRRDAALCVLQRRHACGVDVVVVGKSAAGGKWCVDVVGQGHARRVVSEQKHMASR